jgi:cytochrome P450
MAGHETTAVALSWTWYLLSQHPAVEARMHAEIDAALGGRLSTAADMPRLPYTRMVFSEAIRLYPPAWGYDRRPPRGVSSTRPVTSRSPSRW